MTWRWVFVCLLMWSGALSAQCELAPIIPELKNIRQTYDFKGTESDLRASLRWLLKNPRMSCPSDWDGQNAFALLWLSACPYIRLEIEPVVLTFLDADESLVFTFIHGMAQYQLQYPEEESTDVLHASGIRSVGEVLSSRGEKTKDKALKEIQRIVRKNKELEWVQEKLAQ